MVYYNDNSNNFIPRVKDDIVNHPSVMIGLIIAFIIITVYVIYKYAITNAPVQGYTYFANDILKLDPLFTESTTTDQQCIEIWNNHSNCDGLTYEINTGACIGQKGGRLRTDDDNYYAWVKGRPSSAAKNVTNSKVLLNNINTNSGATISSKDIPYPQLPDTFTYAFYIRIQDWYENYSYWRHVMHKGTPFDRSKNSAKKVLEYVNWENVSNDFPEQCLGFWLSPFQNNLRIAITTTSETPQPRMYDQAHVQKCKCDYVDEEIKKAFEKKFLPSSEMTKTSYNGTVCSKCWITDQENDPEHLEDSKINTKVLQTIEYVDIQDLQTNLITHVVVSLKGQILEVYINGLFKISKVLTGKPKWTNGDLYIHNPKTYRGDMGDLRMFTDSITGKDASDLYNNIKQIQNK